MTRDASLEILKEKLTEREFRKVATQGYSDVSLSVMAESSQKDARNMADTLFSVTSVNKLCDAYKSGVIDERDLNHIMEFARFQKNNEKYLGDMLDSITSHTMYHASAADTFVALAYEECTYVKAVEMIQNRVYTPTDQASLSVYPEVAIELDKLGVHLRGCEGFNYYYDVTDVKQSLEAGDAIFVKDYELAVKVREYMRLSDWEEFRDSAVVFGKFSPSIRLTFKVSKKVFCTAYVDFGLKQIALRDSKGKDIKMFGIKDDRYIKFANIIFPDDKFLTFMQNQN